MSSSNEKCLAWQKVYPVEGDSAVAEILAGNELWCDLHLEGIQLHETGQNRILGAKPILTVYPPPGATALSPSGKYWELDASEALACLKGALEWLLENEKSRDPE